MDLLQVSLGEAEGLSLELIVVIRLVLAAVCGGVIGLERMIKGRPAGLKKFSLVCMGAALIMTTNEYLFLYITGGAGDIARLAAQVVSGIGFLGAGSIIVTGMNQIKGLTTAAALWVTGAIGIAIGAGFYLGGVLTAVLVCVMSRMFTVADDKFAAGARYMTIYVDVQEEKALLRVMELMTGEGLQIKSFERKKENKWQSEDVCVLIDLDFGKRFEHKHIIEKLRGIEGVRYAQEA